MTPYDYNTINRNNPNIDYILRQCGNILLLIKQCLKNKYCRKGGCIRVDGREVAIDRLISSHIRSIGTLGPTYNIRSKISAALNTLKFAPNTLDLKFKYSATEQPTAPIWLFWHRHGVSVSFRTNLKLVGLELDEIHNFNWKHIFGYSAFCCHST